MIAILSSAYKVDQDLYRDDTDARSRRFCVYVGASHVKSQVDDHIRGGNAGKVSLDCYNFGVYWTHQEDEGWFVDINTMATAYRNAKVRMSDDGTHSSVGRYDQRRSRLQARVWKWVPKAVKLR